MNRQQFLLCKLAEEGAEISQIALKTQQFGLHEKCPGQPFTNVERIHHEIDDLMAIVEMLNKEVDFGYDMDIGHITNKKIKVNKYYAYSKELGEVE